MPIEKDLEFLYELGTMRNADRDWRQFLGMETATILEHSIRVIWLALILSRMEKAGDEQKIIKMALVHDFVESRTSDHNYVRKMYIKANEHQAAKDSFDGSILSDFNSEILAEYEKRESIEAKLVKDADNLDVDIELKELEARGSKTAERMRNYDRKFVRDDKLYTESAKKLWDEIQTSDVNSWHLKKNKWNTMPKAGK